MEKIIIFDFNRTLFDPETQQLVPGCTEALAALRDQGFRMFLVSMAAESRQELINELGLSEFFDEIILTSHKSLRLFEGIVNRYQPVKHRSFVIGDRILKEIKLGNQLGLTTIWFRNGKFAEETPGTDDEIPNYTFHSWDELQDYIQDHMTHHP